MLKLHGKSLRFGVATAAVFAVTFAALALRPGESLAQASDNTMDATVSATNVAVNGTFTVDIRVIAPSPTATIGQQFRIDFNDAVVDWQFSGDSSNENAGCFSPTPLFGVAAEPALQDANTVIGGCLKSGAEVVIATPRTFHTLTFECTGDGPANLDLISIGQDAAFGTTTVPTGGGAIPTTVVDPPAVTCGSGAQLPTNTPTATVTATPTNTPVATATPCPNGVCPVTNTPVPTREVTATPTPCTGDSCPTPTPGTPSSGSPTAVPGTVPAGGSTPPPGGGAGGGVVGPDTGSGPSESSGRAAAWWVGLLAAAVIASGCGVLLAVRSRARS
jgi:hypothetical protein